MNTVTTKPSSTVSIVTSLYRSGPYIAEFYKRIRAAAEVSYDSFQLIFVNDGSPDNSLDLATTLTLNDKRVEVIDLSRNYGQHQAMMTGLRFATGHHIFFIDVDLEEPPELLEQFSLALANNPDVDFVFGVVKERGKRALDDLGGRLFYYVFNFLSDFKLPHNIAMARLMKRNCADALLSYPENQIFIGGLFQHIGFRQMIVQIEKPYKGTTSYDLRRKLNLMINAITSFSERPLRLIFYMGLVIWLVSSAYLVVVLIQKTFTDLQLGWASLFASIWFLGGLVIMTLGIIGIYLSKIFLEIKKRPLTLIKKHIRSI